MNHIEQSKSKKYFRDIFYGRSAKSTWINDMLLGVNVIVIFISLYALFSDGGKMLLYIEFGFGIFFLIEYILRFWISRQKAHFVFRLVNMLDILVIGSLLLTLFTPNLAFLRILRSIQILRAYKYFGRRFDHQNEFVYRNFEIATAAVNVLFFLFVMSSIVYAQQAGINANINNYIDALYYTIATVTTTGFGDIVVIGSWGKILSIITMILGVTLFFRLVKSIFVPRQLYSVCLSCGHDHHALYAHFCANCGHKIRNKTDIERHNRRRNDF